MTRGDWRSVFGRSEVNGPVFAVRRGQVDRVAEAATAALRGPATRRAEGSLYTSWTYAYAFLDGGIVTRQRHGMDASLHGSWAVGTRALRWLCHLLDLRPPRRLKEEPAAPTVGELADHLRRQRAAPDVGEALARLLVLAGSGPRLAWAAWACAQDDPATWAAYLDTAVHVDLGERGAFLYAPGSDGTGPELDGDVHVISAHDPGRILTAEDNRQRDLRLRERIQQLGLTAHDAVGTSMTNSHFAPSQAIVGCTRERAIALAREFGQQAIFNIQGSWLQLVPTDGGPPIARRRRVIPTRAPTPPATPADGQLDVDEPHRAARLVQRAGGTGLEIEQRVAISILERLQQDAPIQAPGTPPGWQQIAPGLWMGDGRFRPHDGFGVVVTLDIDVAREQRPPENCLDIVIPLTDTRWLAVDRAAVTAAVTHVVTALLNRRRVLVRCRQGLNRSGLVVGEALAALGHPRREIVELVRRRRDPRALTNPRFADHVTHGTDRP